MQTGSNNPDEVIITHISGNDACYTVIKINQMKQYKDYFETGQLYTKNNVTYLILGKRKSNKDYYIKVLVSDKNKTTILELPLPILISELDLPFK